MAQWPVGLCLLCVCLLGVCMGGVWTLRLVVVVGGGQRIRTDGF